ncbi:MAG: hypothetical protein MR528_01030 [Lachnospiraceae bacterium]|nr:hypothetical protein [Lachnospiraceae bacterium]
MINRENRKIKRKLAAATAVVLLTFTVCPVLSAWATTPTDLEITDDFSEEDISEEELEAIVDSYLKTMGNGEGLTLPETSEHIIVSDLPMEYDEKGKIRYTLPNQSSFSSTAPNGMITEKRVRFEFPDGFIGTVQKDDDELTMIKDGLFTEAGVYQLKLLFYQPPSAEIQDNNVYEVRYSFTIIGEKDRKLGVVTAPEQFRISEVIKNGIPQSDVNPQAYFLMEDGAYEIRYQDQNTGMIHLKTSFVRDTTAPFLNFSRDITQRDIAGPVEFTTSEPNSTVTVTYNGSRGQMETNTLTSGGFYRLEVQDSTGNSRCYQLTIRQTYKLFDTRLIILTLIFLAGLAGRLLFLRRNMKVI